MKTDRPILSRTWDHDHSIYRTRRTAPRDWLYEDDRGDGPYWPVVAIFLLALTGFLSSFLIWWLS